MLKNDQVIIRNIQNKNIEEIVKEAFYTFLPRNTTKNANFVIKPNLGFKTDSKGGTTSIEIIENTLKLLRDKYEPNKIFLVESDGIAFKCEDVFEYLNLDKICAKYNVEFLNLSKESTTTIHIDNNNVLQKFEIPTIFTVKNIKLINLAKLKTHEIAKFSCAIKNLYGLNPYVFKLEYHSAIDDVLQDIYRIFKPDLSIVDAIWAINGHGPWSGNPVKLNAIVSSNDALIADIECLKIIGWDVKDIGYIQKIKSARDELDYIVNGILSQETTFQWCKPSRFGQYKEQIAKSLIPILKKDIPLFYYSNGSFKLVTYAQGKNGLFCKSIKIFPKKN